MGWQLKRRSAVFCKALLALALALTWGVVPGCAKSSSPAVEWERTFGGLLGGSVIETADGACTLFYGKRILQISGDGHLTDDRTLDVGGVDSIRLTSDGGYICTDSNALVKLDRFGGTEWRTDPFAYSIALVEQTADGGYILAGAFGYTGQYKTSWCTQVIWLAKTDLAGALQWEKTVGNEGTCDEQPRSVQQTPDGGYVILTCHTGDWLSHFACPLLIKTDSDGNVVWRKTFDLVDMQSIRQTSDGGYVAVGFQWAFPYMEGSGWLAKIGSTGDKEWERTFANRRLHHVQLTSDGGYVIAGAKETGKYKDSGGEHLPWLVKTDSSGNVQWQKTFGCQEEDRSDDVMSIQQTSDGGYIVVALKECGTADYFGAQLWLIKMKGD